MNGRTFTEARLVYQIRKCYRTNNTFTVFYFIQCNGRFKYYLLKCISILLYVIYERVLIFKTKNYMLLLIYRHTFPYNNCNV